MAQVNFYVCFWKLHISTCFFFENYIYTFSCFSNLHWGNFLGTLDQGKYLKHQPRHSNDSSLRNLAGTSDKGGESQLASIWGKTYCDKSRQLEDIKDMQVIFFRLEDIFRCASISCFQAVSEWVSKGRHQSQKHTSIRALPEFGGGGFTLARIFLTLFLTN